MNFQWLALRWTHRVWHGQLRTALLEIVGVGQSGWVRQNQHLQLWTAVVQWYSSAQLCGCKMNISLQLPILKNEFLKY